MASNQIIVLPSGYAYRYKTNSDGTPGVDYFDPSGQPITNTQFAGATGEDTDMMERSTYFPEGATVLGSEPTTSTFGSLFDSALTSSSGSTAPTADVRQSPLGNFYDVSTPEGRQAFFADQRTFAEQRITQEVAQLQQDYNLSSQEAELIYQRELEKLNSSEQSLEIQKQQATNQFGDQRQGIGETLTSNEMGRQTRFNQASPNAFQSSQIDSGIYDRNKGVEALANVQRSQNLFEDQYNQSVGQLGRERGRLGEQYNLFGQGQTQGFQNDVADVTNQYNSQVGDLAATFATAARNSGRNGFNFTSNVPGQITPGQADTSMLRPYSGFDQLSAAAGQNVPNKPRNVFAAPTQDFGQYLYGGVNPQERNLFADYLAGK